MLPGAPPGQLAAGPGHRTTTMTAIKVSALLFDMDGTLVESASEVEHIWGRWCRLHGIPLQQVLAICHGLRSAEVLARVAPHLDPATEIRVLEDMELSSNAAVQGMPGVRDFLGGLADLPWAVVTSASRRVALQRMQACNLPRPPLLIGSGDVLKGKPDPEPYLNAARGLELPPSVCLVFEDAPAGIQSALAAGCRVVGVGSACHPVQGLEAVIQHWGQVRWARTAGGFEVRIGNESSWHLRP